jgi:hypothetical protein
MHKGQTRVRADLGGALPYVTARVGVAIVRHVISSPNLHEFGRTLNVYHR